MDQAHLAENVAAVTFALQNRDWQASNPTGNPYEIFNGFVGFWSYCARAGIVFAKVEQCDDEWVDAVHEFSGRIYDAITNSRRLLGEQELGLIAREAVATAKLRDDFSVVPPEAGEKNRARR